jgi:lipopolysaccharide transport system permease protein
MKAAPTNLGEYMRFFTEPWTRLWLSRRVILVVVRNEIRGRYAGSLLGYSWMVLYPFMFLGVYAAIYLFIFQVQFKGFSNYEYVSFIFCGLLPFLGFTESLALGVPSVVNSMALIRSNVFPIEFVPIKAVISSQVTQIIGSVLLVTSLAFEGRLTSWALLLPVIWILQLLFSIGLVWILSWINVLMRDLQNIIPVLCMILMIGSPIAYTVEMVPSAIKLLFVINPLYYIIVCYQDCLVFGMFPRDSFFVVLLIMAPLTFLVGYRFFIRAKGMIADYV